MKDDQLTDVTASLGQKFSNFLTNNGCVRQIGFPSLNHLCKRSWNYLPSDYQAIASCIGPGKVQVYTFPTQKNANYFDAPKGDFFVFPETFAKKFDQKRDVLLHEATHMVQDFKRMRLSPLEAEMDAHFAQALFLVRTGKDGGSYEPRLERFVIAARRYDTDPKYLKSLDFRKFRGKLKGDIARDYARLGKDLTKKKRFDGVTL